MLAFAGATAQAAGGYFAMGYGPMARHMAGATTAYAEDAFAGASNPAKWLAAGDRIDIGGELFFPYARVKRTGSNGYDMTFRFTLVPEPTSLALLAVGGLALLRRRDNPKPDMMILIIRWVFEVTISRP